MPVWQNAYDIGGLLFLNWNLMKKFGHNPPCCHYMIFHGTNWVTPSHKHISRFACCKNGYITWNGYVGNMFMLLVVISFLGDNKWTVCRSSSNRSSFKAIISLFNLKSFKKIPSASSALIQGYLSLEVLLKASNIVFRGLKRNAFESLNNLKTSQSLYFCFYPDLLQAA